MEIKTIDNRNIDTNKLPDIKAEMIELIEKSGIRDFVMKHNGICYMICAVPNHEAWSVMHLNQTGLLYVISSLSQFVEKATNKEYKLAMIPNS